ncbi:MAG: SpoIIE family protein phosphatase [Oscillospiraceae bacterium]|nr:SpoIIE family protein phosphatase [Oscillospiraceae bacterium]
MFTKVRAGKFLEKIMQQLQKSMPLFWQGAVFLAGFIAAGTPVMGTLYPLGFAFAAAINESFALAAGAGAIVGYGLTHAPMIAVKYMAGVTALALGRWLLQRTAAQKHYLLLPGIGVLAMCAAQLLVGSVVGFAPSDFISLLAEACIMVGMGVMLRIFFGDVMVHGFKELSVQGKAAAAVAFVSALVVLARVAPLDLNFGYILGAICAMIAATTWGEREGAIAGVLCLVVVCLTASDKLFIGVGIAIAAVVAGAFATQDRLICAGVFFAVSIVCISAAPNAAMAASYVGQMAFATVIFICIPAKALQGLPKKQVLREDRAAGAYISARLTALAQTLTDIGTTVEQVCNRLPKAEQAGEQLLSGVTDSICKRCEKRLSCWVDEYSDTMDSMIKLSQALRDKGCITALDVPQPMNIKCVHQPELCGALNTAHLSYLNRKETTARAQMMRQALTEQYASVADTLGAVAREVWQEECIDSGKSFKVRNFFEELDMAPMEATVTTNMTGQYTVNVKVSRCEAGQELQQELTAEISHLLNRHFAQCQCRQLGTITSFEFYEQAVFEIEFGNYSLAAEKGVCADAVKTFCDTRGNACMILCDGMGTGKEAAIDGNMAASLTQRLLEAGFDSEASARLVNVALSLKQGESSATMDVLTVNLYTGRAQLFKAGAAPSYFIKKGQIASLGVNSLPIGILGSVMGHTTRTTFVNGDVAVLVSDGVLNDTDGDWIKAQLDVSRNDSADEIACRLAENAGRRSAKADDITVAVMRLHQVRK